MKKKISAALAIMMLLCSILTCSAVEARASKYFDSYVLGVAAQGNSEMVCAFTVYGTGKMNQIGVSSIRIEEEIATDTWVTVFTAYGDDDPDTFYSYGDYDHTGEFTFTGMPNVKYRAVMVAYASNNSGEEYSREITCTGRYCK